MRHNQQSSQILFTSVSLWTAVLLLLTACAQSTNSSVTDTALSKDVETLTSQDPSVGCDGLDPSHCLLPFPSDKFLIPQPESPTGYRLQLDRSGMPTNNEGVQMDPSAWNRMDGYGIGWAIMAMFPDVDLSDLPSESDPSSSMDPDAAIVLIEMGPKDQAPTRVPYFVELDDDVDAKSAEQRVLMIRPLVIPKESTRYAVAFRGLKRTSGTEFAPSMVYKRLRDQQTKGTWIESRQKRFDEMFTQLEAVGVTRSKTQLAWWWTTSSGEALHGDMLAIRDQGLKTMGAKGPEFKVSKIQVFSTADNGDIAIDVEGTFSVPHFMTPVMVGEQQAYRMARNASGAPIQKGWRQADFWLRIPHSALSGGPVGLLQYGHGLLGRGNQVKSGHIASILEQQRRLGFACNWSGMANEDYKAITQMIFEFSDFPILSERLHQGMLEQLALARGLQGRLDEISTAIDDKLSQADRETLGLSEPLKLTYDNERLHYTGDSQGGIYGLTYVSLSQDVTRAVLGVPGQNYSLLLRRSVDFVPYFLVMRASYTQVVERALLLQLGQILWDQMDPISYYQHLSAQPFPNTPAHQVILGSAKGDWQVALLTNEITARTTACDVRLMKGYGKPLWGVEATSYPHTGSALVNWDYGNPWPPPGPQPPYDSLGDPHGKPRKDPRYIKQMLHFFATGEVIDVCGGQPCRQTSP
ncbi:MAG: hypothetical protein CMH53_05425 [Myxococcales bacterium]|nr:hypothetical protein [Myxococcales bacterium]